MRASSTLEQLVDRGAGSSEAFVSITLDQNPRWTARPGSLEVAVVHPAPLLVELPDAVVAPRNVQAAHEKRS